MFTKSINKGNPCVPICYRTEGVKASSPSGDTFTKFAVTQSSVFDAIWAAYRWNDDDICYVGTLREMDNCALGRADRSNEDLFEFVYTMVDAMKQLLGERANTEFRILTIAHGMGSLPFLQQQSFPNAFIDSMDIDQAILTVSRNWFCFDELMASNPRMSIKLQDGIKYLKDLQADPLSIQYDVISLDASDSCQILPYFQSREFFEMLKEIWNQWDAQQRKPRIMVTNAYHWESMTPEDLMKTDTYYNAVAVFGKDHVIAHSEVILSVTNHGAVPEEQILVHNFWSLGILLIMVWGLVFVLFTHKRFKRRLISMFRGTR